MKYRRTSPTSLGAFIVTAVLLVTGCGSATKTAAPTATKLTTVRVMLDWTPNTNHSGMYLAQAEGYYRAVGLKVDFIQPGQGSDPNQAVGTGKVDFGVSASEEVVEAREARVPVVSIAAIIQHNTSSLISLKSSGIDRPRDLSGRTYGEYGGGAFEKALVQQLVKCDGGDPNKVAFTEVGEADYRVGLTQKHYDSVWVFDGWDVIRLKEIDKLAINQMSFRSYSQCVPDWYTPVLVTSESLIKNNPSLVKKFMTATAHGYRDAMDQPALAANTLLRAAPGLDRNLVTRSAKYLSTRYASNPNAWGVQDPKIWDGFVQFLEAHHVAKAGFVTDNAFTNAFLPKGS